MDIFTIMVVLWTLLTLMWVVGGCALLWFILSWRRTQAQKLMLSQCDVAMQFPQFSAPEDHLDLHSHTVDGERTAFAQYEWYVARLVFTLDRCLSFGPRSRWRAVVDTELASHKRYLTSDHFKQQGCLAHYSRRMQRLISRLQGEAA